MIITKSHFTSFLESPAQAWVELHMPEVKPALTEADEYRIDQGNETEELARELFPNGTLIESLDLKTAEIQTKAAIKAEAPVIYQATAIHEDLAAKADILVHNDDNSWDLYEVKSGSEAKDEYKYDAGFQKLVFENQGYTIKNTYIVYINTEYVRNGRLNPEKLFKIENINKDIPQDLEFEINHCRNTLNRDDVSRIEIRLKPNKCKYPDILYPDLPPFSVYQLFNRSPKKLEKALDEGIIDASKLPFDWDSDLTPNQRRCLDAARHNKKMVDAEAIRESLSELTFPLYHIDYEAVNPAIPLYDGYNPYNQIVFQYSLHIIESPDQLIDQSKIQHIEFLSDGTSDPHLEVVKHMKEHIGETGSIVVWNKTFECTQNTRAAQRYPEYKEFLEGLNNRTYDLMTIFQKQMYVHPEFYGSYSIKKVLPVLAPELSYKGLDIGEGLTASVSWYNATHGQIEENEKDKIFSALLEYCKLDTWAMVRIWEEVNKI